MRLSLILFLLQQWRNVPGSPSQNEPCPELPDVPHASVSEETRKAEYRVGDVIHYACEVGYVSVPTIRYVCDAGGWSAFHRGTCYLRPCQLPADTPNGYYELVYGSDFVFGATIKYFCNEGYQMVSRADTRTCLLDSWTNHVPVCEPSSCDPPPAEGSVTVTGLPENDDPIFPGRFLTFSCDDPGKRLNGSVMLVCGKDGLWDKPFPTCEEITCEVGVTHRQLRVSGLPPAGGAITAGHMLRFQCNDQYDLEGTAQIECLQNGEWNAVIPTCAERCRVTGVADGVRITTHLGSTSLKRGQKLSFACRHSEHALQGRAEVECSVGGEWSDPFPTCSAPLGCRSPPPLEDGDTRESTRFSYSHNERVEYSCQNLFTMAGEPFKTCINGQWAGQMRCLTSSCDPPPAEGSVTVTGLPENDDPIFPGRFLTFSCDDPGKRLNGSVMLVCGKDGLWDKPFPTCEVRPCQLPADTPNGYYELVYGSDFVFGATIKYFCNEGYQMVSRADTRTCLLDSWTNHVPVCEPSSCDPPPAEGSVTVTGLPENDDPIFPGRFLTFSCDDPGKRLNGSVMLVCGKDGLWDKPFPTCEEITCEVGVTHRQLRVSGLPPAGGAITAGHMLRFQCNDQYDLEGTAQIECLQNGEWNAVIPTCAERCRVTGVADGVRITTHLRSTSLKRGQKLSFACRHSEHALQGRAEVECSVGGEWSDPFPTCSAPLGCRSPPPLEHGDTRESTRFSYSHNERVEYSCQILFTMAGEPFKTCINGQWAGQMRCLTSSCDPPPAECSVTVTGLPENDDPIFPGRFLTFSCDDPGKRLNGSVMLVCGKDGLWDKPFPTCEVRPCQLPADTPNGYYELVYGSDFVFGATIKYFCNEGYQMVSRADTRTCLLDSWTNHVPVCEPSSCDPPPAEGSVTVTGLPENDDPIFPGRFLTFSCDDPGKRLNGSVMLVCGKDGLWDKPFPTCEEITCEVGVTHRQLRVSGLPPAGGAITAGHMLRFQCNDQYDLEGTAQIECLQNGEWNAVIPTCAERCRVTGVADGVRITTHLRSTSLKRGQKLSFACRHSEHALQGRAEVECSVGGEWSDPFPTCSAPLGCRSPPPLEHGDTRESTRFSYSHNERVEYSCQNLFTMAGEPFKTCINGQWAGQMRCLTSSCDPPPAECSVTVTGLPENDDPIFPGRFLTFSCDDPGKRLNGSVMLVCGKDGLWDKPFPTCEVRPCQLPADTPNGYYELVYGSDFVFGATIKYFCNEGYQMVSRADTRTCLLDSWTNHVPVCEPSSCDPPPAEGSVTVTGLPENDDPIFPGRFLTFSCDDPGKRLNGSVMLVCGKDGLWDKPFPTCEEITCEVGVTHRQLRVSGLPPAGGAITAGHMLRFQCNDQYDLEGTAQIECLQNGEWNAVIPTCAERCRVTGVADGVRITTHLGSTSLKRGQKLSFACRHSEHALQGRAEVECSVGGEWSDPFPTCSAPLGCRSPPPLEHGDTRESTRFSYSHNERVEYSCQNLFTMAGEPFKTCINGQWAGQMRCLTSSCDPPPAEGSVTVTGLPENDDPIFPGRFLTFSCDDPGKRLNGSVMLVCGKDGLWDKPFPTCEEITCEVGVTHRQLRVSGLPPAGGAITAGHMLRFQCNDQYDLEGTAQIECLQNGEWNAVIPTCAERCRVTGVADGVRITTHLGSTSLKRGQKLSFACRHSEHALQGRAEVECSVGGEWSDPFPTCSAPLGCRSPPPLEHGDTRESTRFSYSHNERVEYSCQILFTMAGEPFKTCINGQWAGQMRCLRPCTMDSDIMSRHNIAFRYTYETKLYAPHDDVIEFMCTGWRTRVGTLRMRQKCIDGVINLPICQ